LESGPRAVSTAIDRGGTQSSDYDGTGINDPGTRGWKIGTDETTGEGYVHIDGRFASSGSHKVKYISPTLDNSWLRYDETFHGPGYIRTTAGIIVLTGLVKSGTLGATLFTLPEGYRPDVVHVLPTISNAGAAFVSVFPSGEVVMSGASAGWTSLDGIMFPSAGAVTWTPVTAYQSGWQSHHLVNPTYPPLSYGQDVLGRVWICGMLMQSTPGTLGVDTAAFSIPIKSTDQTHFPGIGAGAFASLDTMPSGDFTLYRGKVGTQTNWISLNKMVLVNANVRPAQDWQYTRSAAFLNSWSNYGSGYPGARYMNFRDGIVVRDGLLRLGTVPATSMYMEANAVPDIANDSIESLTGVMIFLASASNAIARVDLTRLAVITGTPAISHNSGSNTWYSHGGIQYMQGPYIP
jgi:hypothetical protein